MHASLDRLLALVSVCSLFASVSSKPTFRLRGFEEATPTAKAISSRPLRQYDPRSPAAIARSRRLSLGLVRRESVAASDSGADDGSNVTDSGIIKIASMTDNSSLSNAVSGSPNTVSGNNGASGTGNGNSSDLTAIGSETPSNVSGLASGGLPSSVISFGGSISDIGNGQGGTNVVTEIANPILSKVLGNGNGNVPASTSGAHSPVSSAGSGSNGLLASANSSTLSTVSGAASSATGEGCGGRIPAITSEAVSQVANTVSSASSSNGDRNGGNTVAVNANINGAASNTSASSSIGKSSSNNANANGKREHQKPQSTQRHTMSLDALV